MDLKKARHEIKKAKTSKMERTIQPRRSPSNQEDLHWGLVDELPVMINDNQQKEG
jgi:hypothetical protein